MTSFISLELCSYLPTTDIYDMDYQHIDIFLFIIIKMALPNSITIPKSKCLRLSCKQAVRYQFIQYPPIEKLKNELCLFYNAILSSSLNVILTSMSVKVKPVENNHTYP